jgi:hypothetical protein
MDREEKVAVDRKHKIEDCLECGGQPAKTRLVNYSWMWSDGDIICAKEDCCRFVRDFDAG